MKKLTALALALCMLFALTACDAIEKIKEVELPELPEIAAPTEEAVEESATEAEANIEIAVEELSNPVIVNISKTTKLFYDPEKGEKLILTFAYDTPKVSIDGRSDAASAINEYLGMLDETYYTGNDYGAGTSYGVNLLYELAIDNYTYIYNENIRDGKLDLVSSREAAVARADSKAMSIVFNDYVYISAQEETHEYKAYNFSTVNGELITLETLGDKTVAFIKDYIVKAAEGSEYSGVIVPNADASAILRDGSWFFGEDGINVFSAQYELTGNGDIVRFIVPYSELAGVLADEFIPDARLGNGKPEIMLLSDYVDGTVEIFDFVSLNEVGEGLILKANGTIYDVSISSVSYNNTTGGFLTTAQHWYCSYMQDNAVQLQTMIPDGMPNLMISYRNGTGETVNKLVTQSGEDGSMILMNTDIEAVG